MRPFLSLTIAALLVSLSVSCQPKQVCKVLDNQENDDVCWKILPSMSLNSDYEGVYSQLNFSEKLARFRIGGKVGYINQEKEVILPPQFHWAEDFSEGLAAVEINGKSGYIDPQGKVIIKPQFDWAGTFTEGLATVGIEGKSGYIDPQGKVVIKPQFAEAGNFSEKLAPVNVKGKYGYIDTQGNFVIKPQFDWAGTFSEKLAPVNIKGKNGYINPQGEVVIKPQFNWVGEFAEGVAAVEINGKYGYIINPLIKSPKNSNVIVEKIELPDFSLLQIFRENISDPQFYYYPEENPDFNLGIGHIRPKDLPSLPERFSSGDRWLDDVVLPLYKNPKEKQTGWLAEGWVTKTIKGDLLDERLLLTIQTDYYTNSLIVLESRSDGWLKIRYALPSLDDDGTAWIHNSQFNLGNQEIVFESWSKFLAERGKDYRQSLIYFRDANLPENLYSQPSENSKITTKIDKKLGYVIQVKKVSEDWMEVELRQPFRQCESMPDESSYKTFRGWIRWQDPISGTKLWNPPKGC